MATATDARRRMNSILASDIDAGADNADKWK
jgi:hypothetical protein